jgi:hypothetical protein
VYSTDSFLLRIYPAPGVMPACASAYSSFGRFQAPYCTPGNNHDISKQFAKRIWLHLSRIKEQKVSTVAAVAPNGVSFLEGRLGQVTLEYQVPDSESKAEAGQRCSRADLAVP